MFISSCFASVFFHSFARKLDVALLIGSRVYMDTNCIMWCKEPQKEIDVMTYEPYIRNHSFMGEEQVTKFS
jgi:hypothetical protein